MRLLSISLRMFSIVGDMAKKDMNRLETVGTKPGFMFEAAPLLRHARIQIPWQSVSGAQFDIPIRQFVSATLTIDASVIRPPMRWGINE
jgi:hypothetical protein